MTRYNTAMGKVEAYLYSGMVRLFCHYTHSLLQDQKYFRKNNFAKNIFAQNIFAKNIFAKKNSTENISVKNHSEKILLPNTKYVFKKGGGGALLLPAVNVSHNLDN